MSESLGDAILNLRADGSELDRDLDRAHGKTQDGIRKAGKGLLLAGAGLSAGLTLPIIEFGRVAAEELGKVQVANNTTDKALARLGAGTLVTRSGVQKLANSLQELSGIDNQVVQGAENMLLQLGNLDTSTAKGKKQFEDATKAVVNWSEATGTDAVGNAKMLAKALSDPEKAAAKLRRAGIKLTEQQGEQIKAMAKAGDTAGAQGVIIEALGKKFKGAANLTDAERWGVLKDKFAEVGAELLQTLMPAFEKFVGWVQKGFTAFENLSPSTKKFAAIGLVLLAALGPILGIIGSLITVLPALGAALTFATGPVGLIIAGLVALGAALVILYRHNEEFRAAVLQAWAAVSAGVTQVLGSLKATIEVWVGWAKAFWSAYGEQIKQVASTAWGYIKSIIGGQLNVIKGIITTVLALIRGDWGGAWNGMKEIVSGFWSSVKGVIGLELTAIKATLSAAWAVIKGVAGAAWNGIKAVIIDPISDIPGLVVRALSGLAGKLGDLGSKAGHALADGIRSAVNSVIRAWNNLEFTLPKISIPSKLGGGSVGGGSFGTPDIPYLASGGIVTRPTLAMIGEAGPEAVVPLGKSPGIGSPTFNFDMRGSGNDMFVASRRAAFNFRTAGLVT